MVPPLPTQERLDKEINKNEFELSFAYPIDQACVMLSVGPTALKTYCRSIGIKRWPYRKVIRCQQLAKKLNSGKGSRTDHKTLLDQMAQLTTAPTSLLWRHLGVDMVSAMNMCTDDGTSTVNTSSHTDVGSAPSPASVNLWNAPFPSPQPVLEPDALALVNTLSQEVPPSMADVLAAALQQAAAQSARLVPMPYHGHAAPTNEMVLHDLLRLCTQLGAC